MLSGFFLKYFNYLQSHIVTLITRRIIEDIQCKCKRSNFLNKFVYWGKYMKASGNLLSRAHLWNKYVLLLLSSRSILQLLFPCQITVLAKKESPVQSLLSPLKSSPGVSMAQSSCLLLLNSVSIKSFAVPICTPAALIATKVTAQCWLFGKSK